MANFSANTPHDHAAGERIGVLVTNLGTPDAPTTGAVRRYLAEFLADPRVIEIPRWIWRFILHGGDPAHSAPALRPRLREHLDLRRRAPAGELASHCRSTGRAMGGTDDRAACPWRSACATAPRRSPMRCMRSVKRRSDPARGASTLSPVLRRDRRLHIRCGRRGAGAVAPGAGAALRRPLPRRPRLHRRAGRVYRRCMVRRTDRPDRLLFSFHGLPRRYLDAGDPYHCECRKTARLVAR